MTNLHLLGNKILIQLTEGSSHEEHETLAIPKFENATSDGGRPTARKVKERMYSPTGTVLDISSLAKEALAKENSPLKVGDTVIINNAAVNYKVFPSYTSLSTTWEGLIAPPHSFIDFIKTN